MKITAEAKTQVRQRIIDAAVHLFANDGYRHATTRDIARAAGIATGTIFNYFAAKESLAMVIIAEALEDAERCFLKRRRGDEELAEDLFAHILEGLRKLKPYRRYAGEVIEKAMSPFTKSELSDEGGRVRATHLETVSRILSWHGISPSVSLFVSHLYWTLYLGVLAFWVNDKSKKQEDTLVVLDQSMRLFAASLSENAGR